MMLTYSVVMGIVYSMIDVRGDGSTDRMKSAMPSTLLAGADVTIRAKAPTTSSVIRA
jgi:hypothetical protein